MPTSALCARHHSEPIAVPKAVWELRRLPHGPGRCRPM